MLFTDVCGVSAVVQGGEPALILAIKYGQAEIAMKLIEMNADVNATDEVCATKTRLAARL